ncbi:MAG: von Willebrand factor type A domain-containing protein [Lachnospiraceae bacterium]|nr:von Willebrand factor type A domain-containing protein [Lachnospiraceae bacterium]
MDPVSVVKDNADYNKRFEFYTSLGYSEKASVILSIFTYGGRELKMLIDKLGKEQVIDKLYAFLLESTQSSPEEAVREYFRSNRPEMICDEPLRGGRGGGFFEGLVGGIANLGRGKGRAKSMPDGHGKGNGRVMEELECTEPAEPARGLPPAAMYAAMPAPAAAAPVGLSAPPAGGVLPGQLQEASATDSYEEIEEKDAKSPLTAPTSTFRMTTNTASMGVVLNQIRKGRSVDISQVRIEELLNYFDYDEESPSDEECFKISTQLCDTGDNRQLLYVYAGAGGRVADHQNIVLLLDVSGSMSSQKIVTQQAIATVVSRLKKNDRFSLITYSNNDETVYKGFEIKGEGDKEDVMGRILSIVISGCTNGSAGIETAYDIGKKFYKGDGNNQVILITDGDLNFGITKKDGLKKLIEEKKKTGIFLSVIGTGLYNYKDDKLEVLAKHGNGTYCVVNEQEDVEESVKKRYVSLTNVVAKDVKAQVEFNPRYVASYRLLGYENRSLSHEDFVNDKVISEPYGAGGHGVALYEIVRNDGELKQELKYQTAVLTDSDELCTVKIRYKAPLSEESTEISKAVKAVSGDKIGGNAALAYFLYCLGEKLRKSDKLNKDDEEYFDNMIKDGAYLKLPGGNEDKIKLIAEYLQ